MKRSAVAANKCNWYCHAHCQAEEIFEETFEKKVPKPTRFVRPTHLTGLSVPLLYSLHPSDSLELFPGKRSQVVAKCPLCLQMCNVHGQQTYPLSTHSAGFVIDTICKDNNDKNDGEAPHCTLKLMCGPDYLDSPPRASYGAENYRLRDDGTLRCV